MAVKIVITKEPNSAKFTDRVLTLSSDPVLVSRSSREQRSETSNAVFDCKVLSKPHAMFSVSNGQIFLKDSGSSNGSFINNFRLSKPGQSSLDSQLFSNDIVRFGSEVSDKNKMVKEKCIVARIRIYLSNGEEYEDRPINNRLYRHRDDFSIMEKPKQVNFAPQNDLIENKVEKLEKIITERLNDKQEEINEQVDKLEKKLKRKQNEVNNLLDTIHTSKEHEEKLYYEINNLKQALDDKSIESEKLADELAIKAKEQLDNIRVTDLKSELEDAKLLLKRTTEENWFLKEKLRVEQENGQKKEREIGKLSCKVGDLENCNKTQSTKENDMIQVVKTKLSDTLEEVESYKSEIKQLNDTISHADEILKNKEKEILWLHDLVQKNQLEIKEKEGEYLNIKCLMTEENETVHQIENEMKRMISIIAEDQDVINTKDKRILSLENLLKEMDESKNTPNTIDMLEKALSEKQFELSEVKTDLEKIKSEMESENAKLLTEYEQGVYIQDTMKLKIEELMKLIEEKNEKIMELKEGDEIPEVLSTRNDILQKEILVLKVSLQQKDLDIKSLNELIKRKEDIISQNDSTIELYVEEVNQLKKEFEEGRKTFQSNNEANVTEASEEIVHNLEKKVLHEQEAHKQTEAELIKIKMEFDDFKHEAGSKTSTHKGAEASVIKSKDEEIERLKKEILQEQQVIAHVQVTQEKEIIEKEKEIFLLNTILKQERKVLLEKEKEIKELWKKQESGEMSNLTPSRPPRYKGSSTPPTAQAAFLTEGLSDDESDTVTFHDALSEDEDILIEDLPIDDDLLEQQHHLHNDVEDFSLG